MIFPEPPLIGVADKLAAVSTVRRCWDLEEDTSASVRWEGASITVGCDRGRGEILKGIASVEYAFKTPTLRNVDRRAPYMHNGSEPDLEAVIELYDAGGRLHRPSLSHEIKPLGLSASEKAELIAFLETLTSTPPPASLPMMPR